MTLLPVGSRVLHSRSDGMSGGVGLKLSGREVVRPEGFEPPTLWFEAKCSIQLSYGRVEKYCYESS